MKPQLTPNEGRIVRAIVSYLSKGSEDSMRAGGSADVVIESIESTPWASLTFAGERHRLVIRLFSGTVPTGPIEARDLDGPRTIVAVERADWTAAPDGAVLVADLLTIEEN